jgi:hypothetical protein
VALSANQIADATTYPATDPTTYPTTHPTTDPTTDPTTYPTTDPTADSIADASESASSLARHVSRLVVRIDGETSIQACEASAGVAAGLGIPLEWRLSGPLDTLPGLVGRSLDASRATGVSRLLFSCSVDRANHAARLLASCLAEAGAPDTPIVLRHDARDGPESERTMIDIAIDLGAPLCDGLGDMVSVSGISDPGHAVDLAYRVLQGARLRATRTEFISCPSCGRTLFDLEKVTARIKALTEHLKGVKIAIMGCIVNGPGEMADADFGYVGSGAGLVTLYVGKQVCVRSVGEEDAPGRLVELIKESGCWVDPV